MNWLTTENCQTFLDRFGSGSDGIIRSLKVIFRYRSRPETVVSVCISVRDSETQRNEGWVNLLIEVRDAKEWVFRDGAVSYQVISSEIHLEHYEGLFFVDFGGCSEQPTDTSGFRQSDFYCAGTMVYWKVEPYED